MIETKQPVASRFGEQQVRPINFRLTLTYRHVREDSPDPTQVWYHRRWLISEIAARKRGERGPEAEEEILAMAREELGYHLAPRCCGNVDQ